MESFDKLTKSIHGEIKLMKEQLGEFPKISRQVASLQRGPNETDMTKMRQRLDIIEGNQTNFKRKIGEIDKKLKEELEGADNKVDYSEDIKKLQEEMDLLKEQMNNLKNNTADYLNEMRRDIKEKPNFTDLNEIEA